MQTSSTGPLYSRMVEETVREIVTVDTPSSSSSLMQVPINNPSSVSTELNCVDGKCNA